MPSRLESQTNRMSLSRMAVLSSEGFLLASQGGRRLRRQDRIDGLATDRYTPAGCGPAASSRDRAAGAQDKNE